MGRGYRSKAGEGDPEAAVLEVCAEVRVEEDVRAAAVVRPVAGAVMTVAARAVQVAVAVVVAATAAAVMVWVVAAMAATVMVAETVAVAAAAEVVTVVHIRESDSPLCRRYRYL